MRAGIAPGHRAYRPFVIVSQARSGSNLLVSLLDSHPQIDARGELLRRLDGVPIATRLEEIYGRKPRRIHAVGFKCFYYHPLDNPDAPIWEQLQAIEGLHVVHLARRNVLRTVTSRRLAGATGAWVDHGEGVAAKPKVRFTPAELREAFEQTEAWIRAYEHRFRDHPRLEVSFEDLVTGTSTSTDVVSFLGLAPTLLQTSMRRQNPEPLSQLIEGFDELRAEFDSTRWAPWFSEG